MRTFKNKAFSKWAAREGLSDDALLVAVREIDQGLVDAYLGGWTGVQKAGRCGWPRQERGAFEPY